MVRTEHLVHDKIRERFGRSKVAVLELEMQAPVAGKVLMHQRSPFHGARFGAEHARQVLVLDFDQVKRAQGNVLRFRRHGRNLIVLAAHLVFQRDVIANEAELESGGILAGQHGMDARQLFCRRGVDAHDPGVRPSGEKDLADQHLRQHHVVDVTCLAG